MKLLRPVEGPITQTYGAFPTRGKPHPIYGDYQSYGHVAIDYGCNIGTPVYAAHDGVIDWAGWGQDMPGWLCTKWMTAPGSTAGGVDVRVDHGDGFGTGYSHLNSTNLNPGNRVSAGQLIGYSGNTGRSGGPHLHFELVRLPAPYDGRFYGRINPQPHISTFGTITPASASITPAAPKPAPKPAQKEWYEMAIPQADLKNIHDAIWHGTPGAKLIQNRLDKKGEWAETTLGSLTDRIIRQQLAPLRNQVASQDAQIRSLVGAVAALSKGEPLDEAKLLAGVKASAAAGVKEAVDSIETTVTIKGA